MTTKARFLPVEPLRSALITRNRYESFRVMSERWARSTGRNERSCNRQLQKIVHHNQLVSEMNADEVCMYVLMSSGVAVYGVEEWASADSEERDA